MLHPNTVKIGMVIGIGVFFFPPVSTFILVLPALSAFQNMIQGGTGTLPSLSEALQLLSDIQIVISCSPSNPIDTGSEGYFQGAYICTICLNAWGLTQLY